LAVNAAITKLSQDRAVVGSHQARLNYTAEQLSVNRENLTAANSRIEDADVAEESTNLARANVLMQSGVAMLAQANSMQQNVLKLLQ
jgi:flagellin